MKINENKSSKITLNSKEIWTRHNKNALFWAFCCVSNAKGVEGRSPQVMRCILCYDILIQALKIEIF
jgi:hypothetical protein